MRSSAAPTCTPSRSGVATFVHDDEESCLDDVRYLLSLLPSNNREPPPAFEPADDPATGAATTAGSGAGRPSRRPTTCAT